MTCITNHGYSPLDTNHIAACRHSTALATIDLPLVVPQHVLHPLPIAFSKLLHNARSQVVSLLLSPIPNYSRMHFFIAYPYLWACISLDIGLTFSSHPPAPDLLTSPILPLRLSFWAPSTLWRASSYASPFAFVCFASSFHTPLSHSTTKLAPMYPLMT